ncbi:MAG TPA: DinB family protein [Vicinamibacterales bacterium]|nr:DinB family protein [Vicinamibacterales bacterium]
MRAAIVAITALCSLTPAVALAQTAASAANPISDSIRSEWKTVEGYIRDSATDMDEANYGFKPVDTVRTFGAILAHVAGANYVFCSAAKGEKSPHGEGDFEKSATTKADIVKALNDSLAYCDAAFSAATDASIAEMVTPPFGSRQIPRADALIGNIGHLNEHYGNLVTYFRIKGIVPPSSRRQ